MPFTQKDYLLYSTTTSIQSKTAINTVVFSPLYPVDTFVYNMCITVVTLWIKSITVPLYVSVCARTVLSFVQSVTL